MTHSINGMAERFREALNAPGVIELPGCYDVISAMLLERAGFATVFLSGYGVAASLLGNPDIGLTSLVETAQAAKNMHTTKSRIGNEGIADKNVQIGKLAGRADAESLRRVGELTKDRISTERWLADAATAVQEWERLADFLPNSLAVSLPGDTMLAHPHQQQQS